mgnify:CR=1 FL=1
MPAIIPSQGRAAAARRAHNPEVSGSIPALATLSSLSRRMPGFAGRRLSIAPAGLSFPAQLAGLAQSLPIDSSQCALKPTLAPLTFWSGASLFG